VCAPGMGCGNATRSRAVLIDNIGALNVTLVVPGGAGNENKSTNGTGGGEHEGGGLQAGPNNWILLSVGLLGFFLCACVIVSCPPKVACLNWEAGDEARADGGGATRLVTHAVDSLAQRGSGVFIHDRGSSDGDFGDRTEASDTESDEDEQFKLVI
jgi:hypothetical protein